MTGYLLQEALLRVEHLDVSFDIGGEAVDVLTDVSFTVHTGEIVGLVGESGSGKSVTCMATLGLLPERSAVTRSKAIQLRGRELSTLSRHQLEDVRGSDVGYVFQDPISSLNPSFTIGEQICEVLRRHRDVSRRGARQIALEMLNRVGIPDAAQRLKNYPHEMSGGMCQRVMIAIALACEPDLLIADEPTTALDVTVQAQIIELLRDLTRDGKMSVLLVTHDLGLVAELCDRVVVMYAGEVIEQGAVADIFHHPQHPYTSALIRAAPRIGSTNLASIRGSVPVAGQFPTSCRFAPRCDLATKECGSGPIDLIEVGDQHLARCIHHGEVTRDEPAECE